MTPVFRLPDDPERSRREVDREIDHHLELKARELEAAGVPPAEARRQAAEAFGDVVQIAEECRDVRGATVRRSLRRAWLEDLRHDLRGALRGLARAPGFAAVAVLTLALGIGANASIFTVLRSVLLAPLPYPEPDRLVQVWTDERSHGRAAPEWLTPPDFLDWRADNRTFTDLAAYGGWGPDLTGTGDPVSLTGAAVSAGFFSVLGVKPALGRDFQPADDHPTAERVVILSDRAWRQYLGADPAAVGRAVTLNGEPWTVIGVLGPEFRGPIPPERDLWRPLRVDPSRCGRSCITLRAIGRLRPGVTISQAQQDLGGIAARLALAYPETNRGRGAWLIPLHDQLTGTSRAALVALSAAVGFVLLIVCVNLANLQLVRGAARARELAVRSALGAGRGRLVRQLLTESAVLAMAGGALGLALAAAFQGPLALLVPASVRAVQVVRIDLAVIAFTALVSIGAALAFGLVPSLRAVGDRLALALRGGARTGTAGDGRLRGALVVLELSLSVVLLVGAGLLFRSFLAMQQVELGYRTESLATTTVFFPRARYQEPARALAAVEDLLGRVRSHPAIAGAEVIDQPPFGGGGDQDIGAYPIGEPAPPRGSSLWYRTVSPGLTELLGIRLVSGRHFGDADRQGSAPVALVNEEARDRYWGGKDPVGRVIASGPDSSDLRATVVGVVANGRPDGPRQPTKPELFLPIGQFPVRGITLVVRPTASLAAAGDAVRGALREVDPLVPVAALVPIDQALARVVAPERTYTSFVGVFAGVALLLAGLGVYGVMAYAVTQRQREIGVRLALGAAPGTIRRLVLGQGARLAILGAGVGIVGAAVASRLMGTLLFRVSAWDPVTFIAVPVVLASIALVAAWIPAGRATRVDPLVAIREE